MGTLGWILSSGMAMAAVALVGSVTLLFSEETLGRILIALVGFAAGSLIGGAMFHMLPAGLAGGVDPHTASLWFVAGFTVFFILEQLLHRHHCRRANAACRQPVTYLILLGDGLHNFLGGLAVAGAFVLDIRTGILTWLVAVAHEIPQELGDFGVLVHGGWKRGRALLYNFLSALAFPLGGVLAYAASLSADVTFLLPFAAGNFVYIAASDLVPEANRSQEAREGMYGLLAFLAGLALLYALGVLAPEP
jgi:zinc and cadmium transporter